MSAQQDIDRHRKAMVDYQNKISRESSTVAQARGRSASARQAAARSTSASTVRSKTSEAQREEKRANDAEIKVAKLQSQLAKSQQDLFKAEAKHAKERSDEQAKVSRRLEQSLRSREAQFRPGPATYGSAGLRLATGPCAGSSSAALPSPTYDLFLSHASEDKDEIARPLADRLESHGLRVWFDVLVLTVGDSLRQRIDDGLATSRYGVVILSPNFFSKPWPQAELDGLYSRQSASGQKVILPIWHHISKDEVTAASPLLAGMLALNTSLMSLDEIVTELLKVLRPRSESSEESA